MRLSNRKSNTILIIILSVLIFLGILWLIRKNFAFKEGKRTMADLSKGQVVKVGRKIKSATQQVLLEEGIDISTLEYDSRGLINQLKNVLSKAMASRTEDYAEEEEEEDAELESIDTILPANYSFFSPTGQDLSYDFCDVYQMTDPSLLNEKCKELTSENCNSTSCCIWLNGKKCVAGNEEGPTFSVDDDSTDQDSRYYSHQNICHQATPAPTITSGSITDGGVVGVNAVPASGSSPNNTCPCPAAEV